MSEKKREQNIEKLKNLVNQYNPYIKIKVSAKKQTTNYCLTKNQKKKIVDLLTDMDKYPSLSLEGMSTTHQVETIINILERDIFYKFLPQVIENYKKRDSKHFNVYKKSYQNHLDEALKLYNTHIDDQHKQNVNDQIKALKDMFIEPLTMKEIELSIRKIIEEDLTDAGFKDTPAETLSKELQKILFPQ